MGNLVTEKMGFLLTASRGFLFTMTFGIQLTVSRTVASISASFRNGLTKRLMTS